MSEGGAESASEGDSHRKADFWKGGENKIHLHTFGQPVSASHSPSLPPRSWRSYLPPPSRKHLPEPSEPPPPTPGAPELQLHS